MSDEAPETVSTEFTPRDGDQLNVNAITISVSVNQPPPAVPDATESETKDLTTDAKLNIISTCLTYAEYEYNVYWQRNALYLTINATMAGGIAVLYENIVPFVLVAFASFGLFLNWHWGYLNRYSKFLAAQWREDAREVAKSSKAISAYYRMLVDTSPRERPGNERPSQVLNRLSSVFKIIWAVILICGFFMAFLNFIEMDQDGELLERLKLSFFVN